MTGRQGTEKERAALSRDLAEFLIEFSIGVHRYAMYPLGHPSLEPVADNIVARLAVLFRERASFAIGVAERQLVIDGVATDQRHPVLSDLARRLHEHQLGAVSLRAGITSQEVAELLGALARDVDRGSDPLGLAHRDELPAWPHARVHPVGYERLEMREDRGDARGDRASALWLGLARAALSSEEGAEAPADPDAVARSIREHEREAAYDQVIVGYLLQLADELKGEDTGEVELVRRKVSRLVQGLDADTLSRLVRVGGNRGQRRRFLLDASQSLSAESVVRLLVAAAASDRQTISHSMTRLLTKLSSHASAGGGQRRAVADSVLREHVEDLLSGWDLADPNPGEYTHLLDALSRAAPVFHLPEGEDDGLTAADRILNMALELDAWGPMVLRAVDELLEEGRVGEVLRRIEASPADSAVASRIRHRLTDPVLFRRLLAGARLDDASLGYLVERMGREAIDPILDALCESSARPLRRLVFGVAPSMGPGAAEKAVRRLGDTRWFVLRNMLGLLGRLADLPRDFDPLPFLDHPDARVRREALALALRRPSSRTRTLMMALSDADERMARMALIALHRGVPEPVLPALVNRVVMNPERTPELRALGVRMLATVRTPLALETLLEIASSGKTLFGKPKLAPTAPDVLVALRGLSLFWQDDEDVQELVQQAARSKDPEVRSAVAGADDAAEAES